MVVLNIYYTCVNNYMTISWSIMTTNLYNKKMQVNMLAPIIHFLC